MRLAVTNPSNYRMTVEDWDSTWSEWHLDRLAYVHNTPPSERHFWTLNGRWNDGYEAGAVCGLCGWRPDPDDARTP